MTTPQPAIGTGRTFTALISKGLGYSLAALLALMSLAIFYQVLSRYFFNAPSMLTQEFLRYALIWLGLLGGGYCFLLGRHLNLPLLMDVLPRRGEHFVQALNHYLTLTFGLILVWGGYDSFFFNALMRTPMLQVPVGTLQLVLVLAGLITAYSQLRSLALMWKQPETTSLLLVLPFVLLSVIVATVWAIADAGLFQQWGANNPALSSLVVMFGTFFVFLIIGSPIAVGLAFSGILTLFLHVNPATVMPTIGETIFSGLDSFGFLALPFFVLAGNLMNETGLARRLIDLAMMLGQRIPGSLWQANILSNMLFGTLSGSGIAAASAIGGITSPVAREKGYDMPMTTAINAASAPAGMLIPPSGALIVYSIITGGSASIIALFVAGYLPGLIMSGCVMLVALWYAKRKGYAAESHRYGRSEVGRIILRAIPSLLMVVLVIGGILGGAFTAIEGSGVAVLYSFILALLYRTLSVKSLMKVLLDTAVVSGVILFLIACSGLMSWTMTFTSIPETIGHLLTLVSDNKYIILLMINAILLIVGVFMDMSPAMLIFTPIFFPVVTELGVDPIHFGIIIVYNLALGLVTPPVGTVLFVSCSITGEKITRIISPLLPIFAMQVVGLLLVTFYPPISLALPRLLGF
ncbi:TRAP transporter large permease subunit [Gilvimarinus agarilyticus]|uniref:TRAP transporter large permease n=1 Tax=Gilvimarinus sp. 2_MG-2023 TaxID=3062666 RepID=UPI001C0A1BAA|nr:TRAP transporter large permease subunit [Gilvimarinus sp. 2_MG-2023]MBU2884456.1 TRAP transporter large permease subunit [Gilvimarinus agarilyticus]MDO6569592.1 TRAP transporter large permease subunit [Gilvimarinus sp. 2_MG-2023]